MKVVLWAALCVACALSGHAVLGLLGALLLAGCLPSTRRDDDRPRDRVTPHRNTRFGTTRGVSR